MAMGVSIYRSLLAAGYSEGVARRGSAALRHSQVLQRAVLVELASSSHPGLWFNNGRFCRLLSAFRELDLKNLKTEYYGRQRDCVVVIMPLRSESHLT